MDYKILFEQVKDITLSVGAFLREERKNFSSESIEIKGLNDLVSYVDKTAEKMLVDGLKKALPEAGFLTEENTINDLSKEYIWIIDPLDGTTNFIHGLPTFSISIALHHNNKAVMGVIYEVSLDELFYSWEGEGAYLNGKQIFVSKAETLSQSLLATGFPYYDFEKADKYLNLFNDLIRKTHGLRRIGTAAVDLAYVACGRFEGYFEYNLNAWDVAAGIFIVKQAGGEVLNFNGTEECINTREVIATNSKISKELLDRVQNFF